MKVSYVGIGYGTIVEWNDLRLLIDCPTHVVSATEIASVLVDDRCPKQAEISDDSCTCLRRELHTRLRQLLRAALVTEVQGGRLRVGPDPRALDLPSITHILISNHEAISGLPHLLLRRKRDQCVITLPGDIPTFQGSIYATEATARFGSLHLRECMYQISTPRFINTLNHRSFLTHNISRRGPTGHVGIISGCDTGSGSNIAPHLPSGLSFVAGDYASVDTLGYGQYDGSIHSHLPVLFPTSYTLDLQPISSTGTGGTPKTGNTSTSAIDQQIEGDNKGQSMMTINQYLTRILKQLCHKLNKQRKTIQNPFPLSSSSSSSSSPSSCSSSLIPLTNRSQSPHPTNPPSPTHWLQDHHTVSISIPYTSIDAVDVDETISKIITLSMNQDVLLNQETVLVRCYPYTYTRVYVCTYVHIYTHIHE